MDAVNGNESEPEAGWRLQQLGVLRLCSVSVSLSLSCLVGTHIAGYSGFFLLHICLSLCLHSSPIDSLGLRVLPLLSHSVLKFYVCFRYFEELVICRDFPHQFFMLSGDHVFHEGWGKWNVWHNEGFLKFLLVFIDKAWMFGAMFFKVKWVIKAEEKSFNPLDP